MFGIEELDIGILLCLNAEILKEIYFLNKSMINILNNKQFWIDKFNYDKLPILDNAPSFQEYVEISSYKKKAEKILASYYINGKSVEIKMKFDVNTLKKLLNSYDDQIKHVTERIPASNTIRISISEKIIIGFVLKTLGIFVCGYKPTSFQEVIEIILKSLYYNYEINSEDYMKLNDETTQFHLNNFRKILANDPISLI